MNILMGAEPENLRCELVSGEDVSFLEGKLKTLIETFGFEGKRGESAKDVSAIILWDWFNYITEHRTDHLSDKKKWYRENRKL